MKKLLSMILSLLVLTTCLAPGIVSFAEDEDGIVEAEPASPPGDNANMPLESISFWDVAMSIFIDDKEEFHFVQAADKVSADRNDIVLASAAAAKVRIYAVYTTRRSLTPAMKHMGMYGWW
ncbi:MAG: hypothetical protein HFI20_06315 [Lachnospiraceae bacterium]|nr:hypothetical protein [Lachnospiraceae bacterium]